jgi:general secretion pathway protein K
MKRMKAGRALRASRGIALIAALWLTVLLAVIASGFAYSMRGEALAARNAISLAQARAAADGAVERAAFELSRPRGHPEAWLPNGAPHSWKDGDIAFTVLAVDEASRIDLNTASEPLLRGLLEKVGGLDADAAGRILDAILDWRDGDDLRRPNGAEAPDYAAAGRKYVPANGQFANVGELQRVLGVTPSLIARIVDSLTVYSRRPGINAETASRDVLLALPGTTAEQVDAFIAARKAARDAGQPIPALPQARALGTAAIPVWRIHAEATLPDGVTFARDAVVRPAPDPRRPLVALLWQEGVRSMPASAPNAGESPTPTNGTGNH